MEDVQYTFFIPCFTAIRGKKCDKCDKDRMIHYKSPQGKDAKELCSCGEPIEIMDFKCLVLYEFALKENGSKINMWFKAGKTGNDNYYTPTQCLTDYIIVEEDTTTEDFKSFDEDESFCFRTQEKCQEYCDWYNKNVLGIDIKDIQEGKQ
jgi:hypothetical protein